MSEPRGWLDRFTLVGHCVVAEGWAAGRDIALWYDGAPLQVSVGAVARPDLVAAFGEKAADWGFALCAVMPTSTPDRSKIRLRLNAELVLHDPASQYRRTDDTTFVAMINRFRSALAERRGSLLEIGSRARSGNTYNAWFPPDQDYTGFDVKAGENVDVVGDAHHLSRHLDQSFDYIFSMATFEHLLMPWKVALEMNKVLKPDGLALIISHGAWPLHEEPWDFFRFSKESWSGLFNAHTGFTMVEAGYQYEAQIVPQYASDPNTQYMSAGRSYLLSGCLVRKIEDARVTWDADTADIYNVNYSHA